MDEQPIINIPFYKRRAFRYLLIACLALIVCAIGAMFYNRHPKPLKENRFAKRDIRAGANRATLTLSDGKKIVLDDAPKGILAQQSGASIMRTDAGQITYAINEGYGAGSASASPVFNSIETPKGGQYQVRLPDGTKVWLNAFSKLSYSASFTSQAIRKVELNGEAYFEVAKTSKPFVVASGRQQVQTEVAALFNISSYPDDGVIKTTVQEGLVRVNTYTVLKVAQESVFTAKGIIVSPANVRAAVAWKNGLFVFENESLENIMKKVARWYDLDVVYSNKKIAKELFSISVSRFDNISAVLKMLENKGLVRFKIKGKTISVR